MLQPSRTKYRKQFRGKNRGVATRGADIAFGEFGLQATTHGLFSARQIEAARKVIAHTTKRVGRTWIRIFPDHPLTKKPLGVKMGSGKGDIEQYVAKIKPNRVLFEIGGVSEELAREALRKAGHKIPMRTKFIKKEVETV
jgi:large subunit ribosomal protein L16